MISTADRKPMIYDFTFRKINNGSEVDFLHDYKNTLEEAYNL
jgi:hypothetical protein